MWGKRKLLEIKFQFQSLPNVSLLAMSKHIINESQNLVTEALTGLNYLNPITTLDKKHNILRLSTIPKRVNLVSGGGSGHEPAHSGFVGRGMLSAAVSGQIFASPSSRQVEAGIESLSKGTGTLLIVKNYTGDILHFGLAKERWASSHPDKSSTIRLVVVGDDVAVTRSQGALTGRRGLAAVALVEKISGALAVMQANLDEVEFIALLTANSSATIGMGLDHCHVPGTGNSTESYLKSQEIELGMGIHNEPGVQKISPIPSAAALVNQMMTMLTSVTDKERSFLPFQGDGKDSVILLVNNLGGLPLIELLLLVNEALIWLAKENIQVERVISGSLITSLNLPGFSFTLLLLPRTPVVPNFKSKLSFDSELLISCFDAPTDAPGWPWSYKGRPESHIEEVVEVTRAVSGIVGPTPSNPIKFLAAIEAAIKKIIEAEPEITRFDTIAGDGDAGLTLKSGGEGILAALASNLISSSDVVAAISTIGDIIEETMGGTSGSLYSIFISALKKGILDAARAETSSVATPKIFALGLEFALKTLYIYTKARSPSRTLIDPLSAFISTFSSNPEDFEAAYLAAKLAAEETKNVIATAGRAAYVDQINLSEANVPDAGAWGVLMILEGIKSVL